MSVATRSARRLADSTQALPHGLHTAMRRAGPVSIFLACRGGLVLLVPTGMPMMTRHRPCDENSGTRHRPVNQNLPRSDAGVGGGAVHTGTFQKLQNRRRGDTSPFRLYIHRRADWVGVATRLPWCQDSVCLQVCYGYSGKVTARKGCE